MQSNAVTTTTTEVTSTTTRHKRSLHDIKFPTYLQRQASAHDLHQAGIVPDDMAEKLEMGVLREEDVSSGIVFLLPYFKVDLFGNISD